MANAVLSSLQWEDEIGEIIEAYNGIPGVIGFLYRLLSSNPSVIRLIETHCLQFIDPYGDTTFNQIQIPKLLEEIGSLEINCWTEDERRELKSILEFIGKAKGEIHTYIKFYGD